MALIDNLSESVNTFESSITLKSDYSDELEKLDGFESDAKVLQHLNAPVYKCRDIINQVNRIRLWIQNEEAARV